MFYIVALGNPGREYEETRHNVGWFMADALREQYHFTAPVFSARYQGRVSHGQIEGNDIVLLYPDTFMNHSGVAVKKLVPREEVSSLVVLYDDTALPLAELKISHGRGDGGHNGIKSIITELGTREFSRIRIGIAPRSWLTGAPKLITGEKLPKFVLGRFTTREQRELETKTSAVCDAVRLMVLHGVAFAMNRYNGVKE